MVLTKICSMATTRHLRLKNQRIRLHPTSIHRRNSICRPSLNLHQQLHLLLRKHSANPSRVISHLPSSTHPLTNPQRTQPPNLRSLPPRPKTPLLRTHLQIRRSPFLKRSSTMHPHPLPLLPRHPPPPH